MRFISAIIRSLRWLRENRKPIWGGTKFFTKLSLALAIVIWIVDVRQRSEFASYGPRRCLGMNFAWETILRSHAPRNHVEGAEFRKELEAIARVVFARVKDGRRNGFRNSICKVVYQYKQFSWTLKFKERVPADKKRWHYMLNLAEELLQEKFIHPWPADHQCIRWYKRRDNKFTTKGGRTWFDKNLRPVVTYGYHTFYCKKGST